MALAIIGWLVLLNPFKTPDTQRLAILFGVVYFAQGMWYLPNQAITIVLKDRGLAAGQVADFFLITRSEEHTSELSHDQISYAVFCLKKKKIIHKKSAAH